MFIESQGPFPPKTSLEREVFWNWHSEPETMSIFYIQLVDLDHFNFHF